ncbi:hypothetical protein [Streptomyces sp. Ac-502]|uniref:hypothetical protein n=1 Tax=Streptomyces sp. Ac-502 TaxID=3342801 RepID=UPI00386290BD
MNAPDPRNDRIAALPAHLQEQLRRRLAGGARKAAEIPAVPGTAHRCPSPPPSAGSGCWTSWSRAPRSTTPPPGCG